MIFYVHPKNFENEYFKNFIKKNTYKGKETMKIYNDGRKVQKSWSIALRSDEEGDPMIYAVDSKNGRIICSIMIFQENGFTCLFEGVEAVLEKQGYDPLEHNTKFDGSGAFSTIKL